MERIQHNSHHVLVILFISVFFVVLLRTAWMSDDAYITLRTVDNFVNGYGLTWNVSERVQGYTHPLWMFVLSGIYFITGEAYFSVIILSIVLSLTTLFILTSKVARSLPGALIGVAILLFSRAYIDYSTSGLENPLTHMLLVTFFVLYLRCELNFLTLTLLALNTALGVLNRMDTLLLFAPALAYVTLLLAPTLKLRTLYALLLGFTPFVLWELFSLWYYGFLFPNTAYAKLNTGIERSALVEQGMYYLLDSLNHDPITLLAISCAIVLPFLTRQWRILPISLGIGLYLIYIVRIGGDFMSGRFLSAPLLCSVVVITYSFATLALSRGAVALLIVVLVGLIPNYHNITATPCYGIMDERQHYYDSSGLLNVERLHSMPRRDGRDFSARQLRVEAISTELMIGLNGFRAGPNVHIVDLFALTDPLLARMPAIRSVDWRPGHFNRTVPAGYLETLESGENLIEDVDLARYYEKLSHVTRGSLFDRGRLWEIWKINTGSYDELINFDAYRYPDMAFVHLTEINGQSPSPHNIPGGIEIDLEGQHYKPYLEIELSHDDDFQLVYLNGETEVGRQYVETRQLAPNPLQLYVLDVPAKAVAQGYTRVRILPMLRRGDPHRIGAARLLESREEMMPHIELGLGWELLQDNESWARSPANVHLFSSRPQPALLEISLSQIYDPNSSAMPPVGDQGVLHIYSDNIQLASIPVTTADTVSVPILLSNGQQKLSFSLQAGNFTIEARQRSFAANSIRLQLLNGEELNDILVNGELQQEDSRDLGIVATYGNNWYDRESESSLRWSQSPANIFIYSSTAQWVEFRLTPAAMHDSDSIDGMGYQGIMHITTNGDQPREGVAVVGQPLVTVIRLEAGINQVTLSWEDGNFRPAALDANNPDERLLSFAIEQIDLQTSTPPQK